MPNAKSYSPATSGVCCAVLGPPGTGKSWFLRSALEWATASGKRGVLAITQKPELDSYAGCDVEYEVFIDPKWQPKAGSFVAVDYLNFYNWLGKVAEDDSISVVCVDRMDGISDLAMQDALKTFKVGNPMDIPHGRAYGAHNSNMAEVLQRFEFLLLKGKHVVVSWHTQMRESEATDAKESKQDSSIVEFEERALPVMHGSLRQRVGGFFSLWLHTRISGYGPGVKYYLTSLPGRGNLAKRRLKFVESYKLNGKTVKVNDMALPNDFASLMGAIGR